MAFLKQWTANIIPAGFERLVCAHGSCSGDAARHVSESGSGSSERVRSEDKFASESTECGADDEVDFHAVPSWDFEDEVIDEESVISWLSESSSLAMSDACSDGDAWMMPCTDLVREEGRGPGVCDELGGFLEPEEKHGLAQPHKAVAAHLGEWRLRPSSALDIYEVVAERVDGPSAGALLCAGDSTLSSCALSRPDSNKRLSFQCEVERRTCSEPAVEGWPSCARFDAQELPGVGPPVVDLESVGAGASEALRRLSL
mmetsp:Transcript_39033/g.112739  ORF Transcript_39033/g.112739 Transcript_39033/m.112739 type:complete len:258 (-) Transcript_39033:323-1096(-)